MAAFSFQRLVRVIDSHTAGEPTRVVVVGGPDLGNGPMAERRSVFQDDFDRFRSTVVNEPRGSDVLVGALLCPPHEPTCDTGVLFFNNVGGLGMCVHGTIGVVATLAHLDRIRPGDLRLDTPVGIVTAQWHADGRVTVANVPSYRHAAAVSVDVAGLGTVTGDVAWGGNWFFLVHDTPERIARDNVERLTDVTWRIRQALVISGVTGADGAEVDHIEMYGPPGVPGAQSKNFVLCPGKAYDRSPCGTGTSAKIACLLADGVLAENEKWCQESIVGTCFDAWGTRQGQHVLPYVEGRAFITGDATLLVQHGDPFAEGIRS